MRDIAAIIKAAGGARAIHEASAAELGDAEKAIQKNAVYKWPTIGIPDRHWPLIIRLADTTPAELFEANIRAREKAVA